MNTAQAIKVTSEWVATFAAGHPEFRGAHLMGGITHESADALFPADSDVDVSVVVDPVPPPGLDPIDEFYGGVLVEAGLRGMDEYASPEKVLANPEIADHLAVDSIIADPIGLLGAVQPIVAQEFSHQHWVMLRCDEEKRRFQMWLARASRTEAPIEFLLHLTLTMHNLASLIAVAWLAPPTHRKCFVLLREQLHAMGHSALFEETLAVCGVAHLSRARVQAYAEDFAVAYDRALQVKRTPFPFDFKLRPHVRSYTVDGTQSMIDLGDYREAMPWIGAGLFVATTALFNDAPAAERPHYERLVRDLIDDLGLSSASLRAQRLRRASDLSESLVALANKFIAGRSDYLRLSGSD